MNMGMVVLMFAVGIMLGASTCAKAHGPEFPHNDPDPVCWVVLPNGDQIVPPEDYGCFFLPKDINPYDIRIQQRPTAWDPEEWGEDSHYYDPNWNQPPAPAAAPEQEDGNGDADMTLGGFQRP